MYDLAAMGAWLEFAVRWLHVITAIAWIGSSFYFIALDLGLRCFENGEQLPAFQLILQSTFWRAWRHLGRCCRERGECSRFQKCTKCKHVLVVDGPHSDCSSDSGPVLVGIRD